MIQTIIVIHVVIFSLLFCTKLIWAKLRAIFAIEEIVLAVSKLFPILATVVALVQTTIHWGHMNILGLEAVTLLATGEASRFLYRRSKGLVATFGRMRMDPSDGTVGCLTDGLVAFAAVTFILMGAVLPIIRH